LAAVTAAPAVAQVGFLLPVGGKYSRVPEIGEGENLRTDARSRRKTNTTGRTGIAWAVDLAESAPSRGIQCDVSGVWAVEIALGC